MRRETQYVAELCRSLIIQSVGRLGFDQFPLWKWGAARPSSSTKQSFLPARSSGAEGHLPADPHLAFLQRSSRGLTERTVGIIKLGQRSIQMNKRAMQYGE